MKRQLRKALAILCAVAFAFTGITFTPQSVDAGSEWIAVTHIPSGSYTPGNEYTLGDVTDTDEGGIWSLQTGNNEWGNYTAKYQNADKISGFTYDSEVYHNGGGAYLRLRNLFDLGIEDTKGNPIKSGVKYNVTVSLSYGTIGNGKQNHYVNFFDNYTNIYDETVYKEVKSNTSEDFKFTFTPKSADGLNLLVAWAKKESWGDYSQKGVFTVDDVVFEPADDFTPDDNPNVDYHPGGNANNPWTLKPMYDPDDKMYGAMSYKVDGDLTDVSSTFIRVDEPVHDDTNAKLKTDDLKNKKRRQHSEMSDAEFAAWWSSYNALEDADAWWWWNSCKLKDYMTSLDWGYRYTPTLKVKYTRPDGATHPDPEEPDLDPELRVIFNGEVILKNMPTSGEYTIKLCSDDGFVYTGQYNDIEFNLDLLDKYGIIQVSELTFEKDPNFMPVTPNVSGGFNPTGTPWYYSVQNNTQSSTNPDLFGMTSYYVSGSPKLAIGSTQTRVDTPAHDDSNDILKSDALKDKKRAEYSEMSDAEFADFWEDYDAVSDPDAWWWWNASKLPGYMSNLKKNKLYTGSLTYKYTAPTDPDESYSPKLRMLYGGNSEIIDLSEGTHTVDFAAAGFKYDGEHKDIEFNLDLLEEAGIIQITDITFDTDKFEPVDPVENPDDPGFNPTGTPWTIKVINDPPSAWGEMSCEVDEASAADVSGTTMRNENPAHDDSNEKLKSNELKAKKRALYPDMSDAEFDEWWANYDATEDADAWWWWNSASLRDYLPSRLHDGRTYSGTMVVNYTAPTSPTEQYTPKLRYILNGEVHVVTLEDGKNTIDIDSFDYSDVYPNIEFNLDTLEKNSLFQVESIEFEQAPGNWMRVPDNIEEGVDIPVTYDSELAPSGKVTHTWNLFAGIWEGHGAALYYDNDIPDYSDPLKVKIGAGERWDPACAQIKLTNEDAYQELEEYTNYYMTYSFTSTEKGTLHINHEGYTPTKLTRIDITDDMYDESDGLYHVEFKKIFTYLPDRDDLNLTMFLTPTTYVYNEQTGKPDVKMDGEYLPAGTIIANHKIEFTRQDKDGWTLVTDSRDPDPAHQKYDDLVKDSDQNPLLQAYTNSFGYSEAIWSEYDNGRMSYLANQNPDGVDDIAKMGIRLDSTAYSNCPDYTFDNNWTNHLRIPNDYFYARPDTNGNYLKQGHAYKLRFYINSTEATAENMGLIMVRQGYDMEQWFRYPISKGLNLVNGTLQPKKNGSDTDPYIVNKDYKKTGGIDFVYNEGVTTDDKFVQFDFSEFPQGTTINDISWEFEAEGYNVFLDGSKTPDNTDPIMEGDTYTFPTEEGVIGYQDDYDPQKVYRPGEQVPYDDFTDDIYATSIRGYKVVIVDTDGNPLKTTYVDPGDPYSFPTVDDPDFKDFKEYKDDDNTYHNGDTIPAVNQDYTFVAVPKGNYIVTVQTPEGLVLRTTPVEEGGTYTFPSDIEGVQDYTYNGQTYQKGATMGPVNENRTVIANPIPVDKHTVTIVDANDPTRTLLIDEVDDGEKYELPEIENVKDYTYNQETYDPTDKIGPITTDVTVYANPVTHTVTIVNAEDHRQVLHTSDPIVHGSNYELPTLPNYDIKNYVYDGVNYQPGQDIGPINADTTVEAVLVPYYKVSIDGVKVADIRDGDNYTFPSGDTAAKIGYISVDGGPIYDPGSTVGPIHENRDYISIDRVDVTKQSGAAMYFNKNDKDNKGIAFGTEFRIYDQNGNMIDKRKDAFADIYKSEGFKVGTLITPYDIFNDYFDGEIDLSSVQKAQEEGHPNYIYNVLNDNTFMRNGEASEKPYETYRAGIVGMADFNIPREFIARAYAYVETASGRTVGPDYADYSDTRSIKQIATNIKNNPAHYNIYEDWEQIIIDKCYDYQG